MLKKLPLFLMFASSLVAEDVMVERMQSVVDEVVELRKRYENAVHDNQACLEQLKEQSRLSALPQVKEETQCPQANALQQENIRLKATVHKQQKDHQKLSALQEELSAVKAQKEELDALVHELRQKNASLFAQVYRSKAMKSAEKHVCITSEKDTAATEALKEAKHQVKVLQAKNAELEKQKSDAETALQKLSKACEAPRASSALCPDENPFPKLLMKDEQQFSLPEDNTQSAANKEEGETQASLVISHTGYAYRLNKEAEIYDAPNARVIGKWEEQTSFTSNISSGDWIKITGYFVDRKWRKSEEEMWVRKEDALKR